MSINHINQIIHEPDFTSENNIAPEGVPSVGVGAHGHLVLVFENGARVPIRSKELNRAQAHLHKLMARGRLFENRTPAQVANFKQQAYDATQMVARAQARCLEMFGVTRTGNGTFTVNTAIFPAVVHTWHEKIAA